MLVLKFTVVISKSPYKWVRHVCHPTLKGKVQRAIVIDKPQIRSIVKVLTKQSFSLTCFNYSTVMVLFRMSIVCLLHVMSSRKNVEICSYRTFPRWICRRIPTLSGAISKQWPLLFLLLRQILVITLLLEALFLITKKSEFSQASPMIWKVLSRTVT
jgi:hypothetical protein